MSRDPLIGPQRDGDTRFESALRDVKHSKAYHERKSAAARPRVNLKALDIEYRRMLGVPGGEELPKRIGVTSPSSTGKGRRGRLVRKVKNKSRNTTMKKAISNVR